MASRLTIVCDRCGDDITDGRFRIECNGPHNRESLDLCGKCKIAWGHFMNNLDEVGDYHFVLEDGPCPHHIPCAGPCTTVWTRVKRT